MLILMRRAETISTWSEVSGCCSCETDLWVWHTCFKAFLCCTTDRRGISTDFSFLTFDLQVTWKLLSMYSFSAMLIGERAEFRWKFSSNCLIGLWRELSYFNLSWMLSNLFWEKASGGTFNTVRFGNLIDCLVPFKSDNSPENKSTFCFRFLPIVPAELTGFSERSHVSSTLIITWWEATASLSTSCRVI